MTFSTNLDDYKALVYFEIKFELSAENVGFSEPFDFHVPIVKENDGLFYALAIESNQVAYGSTIQNAIDRIGDLLSDMADEAMKNQLSWFSFLNDEMDSIYGSNFHALKKKYNLSRARRLDSFVKKHSNEMVESVFEKKYLSKIKNQLLGTAYIEEKYRITESQIS